MKINVFKFGWLVALLLFSVALTGCIDVLHMVRVTKNSLTIQYRIALSKQITQMQEDQEERRIKQRQKRVERLKKQREEAVSRREAAITRGENPPPLPPRQPDPKPVVKKKSPLENMGDGFADFSKKNKRLLRRYKAGKINSNMEVGWKASFIISKRNSNKIKVGKNPPLAPRFDIKKKRMVFEFRDNPMEKGKKKKKSGGKLDDSAAAIFSTALYTMIISGSSRPKSAYIQEIGGKGREKIEVIKGRGFSVIKFPWISMFIKFKQFRLVVQL